MITVAFFIVMLKTLGVKKLIAFSALITWSAIPTPSLISRFSGPILWEANFFEVAIFLSLFALVTLVLLRQNELSKSPYWPLFAIFSIFGLIGFLIGYDPDRVLAWRQFRQTCLAPFALYFLITQFLDNPKDAKRAAIYMLVGGFLICLLPITGFREVPASSLSIQELLDERLSGAYDLGFLGQITLNLNSGSFLLALFVVLGLCILWGNCSNKQKLFAGIVVATGTAGVVGMATRATWLSLILIVPMVFLFSKKYGNIKLTSPFIVAIIAISASVIIITRGNIISKETESRWNSVLSIESLKQDANFQGRMKVNKEAFQLWQENPMGTGFVYLVPGLSESIHSLYFDYLLGTGLAGLLAFIVLMTLLFSYCLKALRVAGREDAWLLIAAMASIGLLMIFGLSMSLSRRFYVYITFWTIVSLGVVTARSAINKQELENDI
jgi:O-antigen ligase